MRTGTRTQAFETKSERYNPLGYASASKNLYFSLSTPNSFYSRLVSELVVFVLDSLVGGLGITISLRRNDKQVVLVRGENVDGVIQRGEEKGWKRAKGCTSPGGG